MDRSEIEKRKNKIADELLEYQEFIKRCNLLNLFRPVYRPRTKFEYDANVASVAKNPVVWIKH